MSKEEAVSQLRIQEYLDDVSELDIPHSESIFPDEDRINGSHIDESISKAFEKSKKFIQEGGKK